MVHVTTQARGGKHLAVPDVCKTPAGPSMVPMVYPNEAETNTSVPGQLKVVVMSQPAHNQATLTPVSKGDQAGTGLGMLSNLVMGPVAPAAGSSNLFLGPAPAIKMATPTKQNGINANVPGLTVSPSQMKLQSLR